MLKKIKIVERYNDNFYPKDINRIIVAMAVAGYFVTEEQAQKLWAMYSDDLCAGWLGLPADDEELLECIRPYFKEDV